MSLYENLQCRLPEFSIEHISLSELTKYENVFYSNKDYYMITEGRPAEFNDCVDTIKYVDDIETGIGHSIGVSLNNHAVAFLSLFEGFPSTDDFYIGLLLIDKTVQKLSLGTKIINAVIDMAFSLGFTAIKLSVQDNNISGYSFWKKMGFKCVGQTKCDGFNNISMELKKSDLQNTKLCYSYVMGIDDSIFCLNAEGFDIKRDSDNYTVSFTKEKSSRWEEFIAGHLKFEYWNEYFIGNKVVFLFHLRSGIKRFEVENYESDQVLKLCEKLCGCKFESIKSMLFENWFYKQNGEGGMNKQYMCAGNQNLLVPREDYETDLHYAGTKTVPVC